MSGKEHKFDEPFVPLSPRTGSWEQDCALRIAAALEYIAVQVGEINRKFDSARTASKESEHGKTPLSRSRKQA